MNGAVEFLKTLGPARLAAMGVVAALLVGFFAFIIVRASAPVMATLYSDLSVQDSGQIVKELEAAGIAYELRQEGGQILVPKDELLRLRMKLAEKGIPAGGSVGYEIFDKSDALGTTSFVQNINHLRALEGELARTIRAIDRIQAARVHLVIPERQLFQREKAAPSASIVLKLRGALEPAQIRSIQHLVASAVEGLKPARVSVVDEKGTLLGGGQEEDPQGMVSTSLQERTTAYERRLEGQIESIVGSVVGQGRARVRVSAELDFNRVTQTSDTFDPNGQVVRSTQTKEESSTSAAADRAVSVGNQVPGAQQQNGGNAGRDASSSTEELVNYEISKTSRTEVVEAGRIKRLSVAVLVDGVYTTGASGEVAYQPRSREDIDRITALVRSAVGFDQARGDQVEVVNLRFAEAPASLPLEAAPKTGVMALIDFTKDDILRLIELGVLFVMTLLVLLFAVRPLIRRMVEPQGAGAEAGAAGGAMAKAGLPGAAGVGAGGEAGATTIVQMTVPAALGPDGKPLPPGQAALPVPAEAMTPHELDQAKQIGALQATSIQKVGELINEYPAEATALIRGWLMEG